jgi:hypothetical protein
MSICVTVCWPCQFGNHDSEWHTWADGEDVAYAFTAGHPDPRIEKCGCECCEEATR